MAGGYRGQRAPSLPSRLLPGQGGGGKGQRPWTARPGRADFHTKRPCPMHPPGVTRAWLAARTLALRFSRGHGPRRQCVLNGKQELFLCLRAARVPTTSGSRAPSPAGVHPGLKLLEGFQARRTDRASLQMASPPWAALPGLEGGEGTHGSSPPKFVVPWKKRLSLTEHKGETPWPSPEKPGIRVGG